MRPNNTDLFRAVALVACLSFSACTTGEVELLESLPLEVYAEIKSPATATKVDTDAHANDYDKSVFVDDDEISIFLSTAPNVKTMYKKSGSQWIPTSTAITTSTNSDLYTATYPTSFTAILSDQTTATNFWKSNQLKAEATAVHNKVNLTFAPAAVKVTITIIYEDGSSEATQATISATDIATESGKSGQVVLFRNSDNNGTHTYGFIGIVNPETSGSKYKISITKGVATEESKEFNLSDLPDVDGSGGPLSGGKFCAGYNYNYTFTSSTNLILNSVTVTPFGDPISGEDMSAT